jgi:hypothetical protein
MFLVSTLTQGSSSSLLIQLDTSGVKKYAFTDMKSLFDFVEKLSFNAVLAY